MKQLVCPNCAAVLQRPQSKDECNVTCYLCGGSFRLSRRSGADAGVSPRQVSVSAPTRLVAAPAAPQVKARQSVPRIETPQASPSPEPDSLSFRRWIAAAVLLLIVVGFCVGLVLLSRSLPADSRAENASVAANASEPEAATVPASRSEEIVVEEREPTEDAPGPVIELRMREVVQIDARGDAAFVRTYRFPMSGFTKIKTRFANSNVLRRELGFRQHWHELRDFRVEFDDAASAMRLRWTVRGLARLTDEGRWLIATPQEAGLNVVSNRGNEAVLTGKVDLEFGPETLVTRIVRAPRGSSDIQLRADRRLGFRMAAASASPAGEASTPRFVLQAKPRLLACLGQVYAQPKFARFWTARCVFQNTSGQTLRDYSVHFRLAGYTSGSKEFSCPLVLPGQSVVDAYFPLLDFKKLVELTDATQVHLEVEYQYRQADGQRINKKETRIVQLLSRNQAVFSSLLPAERLDGSDRMDNMPFILAALTTKDDKVIEEMAGRIARRQGGTNADDNHPEEMLKFMEGVYNFMSAYIRYQIPASDIFDGSFSQTIMYGRDVLNKKAGTCIDLAILYASTCLAQDVKPLLILIPGHCFPVIKLPRPISLQLPDGRGHTISFNKIRYLGVETTMIGSASFAVACCRGTQNFYACYEKGTLERVVDIYAEHRKGVRSLPFPVQSLKDLGISDDDERWAARTTRPGHGGRAPSGGFLPPSSSQGVQPGATPVGQWFAHGRLPDGTAFEYTLTLSKDGSYKLQQKLVPMMPRGVAGPPMEQEITGTYKVGQESIVFTSDNKEKQVCEYSLRGTRLFISMPHLKYGRVHFNFLKLPD